MSYFWVPSLYTSSVLFARLLLFFGQYIAFHRKKKMKKEKKMFTYQKKKRQKEMDKKERDKNPSVSNVKS